jgi:protein-S-isoprenylcysteine O-methyltransferase Ste14
MMPEGAPVHSDQEKPRAVPWWRGARGEWLVLVQLVLFAVVIFGPRTWRGCPVWMEPFAPISAIAGALLLVAGGILILAGALKLGVNLTPVPYPRPNATLIETGAFRFVRHPMYSGGILMAFGWGLWVHGWLTTGYALLLFVFFDIKSRREERWLREKFPGYAAYQNRVRKLIPFVY